MLWEASRAKVKRVEVTLERKSLHPGLSLSTGFLSCLRFWSIKSTDHTLDSCTKQCSSSCPLLEPLIHHVIRHRVLAFVPRVLPALLLTAALLTLGLAGCRRSFRGKTNAHN